MKSWRRFWKPERNLTFPPKPAELIEILDFNRKRRLDKEYFRIMDEKRLLPAPPKLPATREVLEAKAKMWQKLGMREKKQGCLDEIARMDLQEK